MGNRNMRRKNWSRSSIWVSLMHLILSSSSLELLCDGGNVFPLVECLLQLELSWLSWTIPGKSSCTIWTSSLDALHFKHASSKCVPNGYKYHPMVNQLSDGSQPKEITIYYHLHLWYKKSFQRCFSWLYVIITTYAVVSCPPPCDPVL